MGASVRPSLLRYAQDLAWYHSAYRGFTRDWYRERGLTWLARAAEVAVEGDMRVGDEIVGTTQVVGWRRVWARRRTDFVDAAGTRLAWTNVDWVLLDSRGHRPAYRPTSTSISGLRKPPFRWAESAWQDRRPRLTSRRRSTFDHRSSTRWTT